MSIAALDRQRRAAPATTLTASPCTVAVPSSAVQSAHTR
jgi:hypothetical protein